MPKTQSNLKHLTSLFDIAHFDVLQRLYESCKRRTESGDFDESKFYEGWDAILNHFRMQTNYDITIAPQRRFSRNFYDEKEPGQPTAENLSTEANLSGYSLSNLSVDQSVDVDESMTKDIDASVVSARSIGRDDPILSLGTQSRIPDFALFYTHTVQNFIARELILLVEIKPYTNKKPTSVRTELQFERLALQIVTQALFALDESSDITEIKVLCVIGWDWRMVGPFRTGQNFTDISQVGYEKPSGDVIMLPKMPQGKFHTDVWSTELDIKDGYTKRYIDALDSARLLAIEQLSEDFQSVFEFQGSRIVAYNPGFLSAWSSIINNANIPQKY